MSIVGVLAVVTLLAGRLRQRGPMPGDFKWTYGPPVLEARAAGQELRGDPMAIGPLEIP